MPRNMMVSAVVVIVGIALTLSPEHVRADTVDNPGPFTLMATSGDLIVGTQQFDFGSVEDPPSIMGLVDADGNLTIPASGIAFSDFVISVPFIGAVTVRVIPLGSATGLLNPITGESSINFSARISLINRSLPANCGIGPIVLSLVTGDSGGLAGVPYDQTTGIATYVDNLFDVPKSDGCGPFGGSIDGLAGLPSPSGINEIQLMTHADPVLTGS